MKPFSYRPILLLPLILKISEKIKHDQMTFDTNISLTLEQNIKLIYVFYTWMIKFSKALILIDLQKDTIDHNILFEKLKAICFYGDTVNWFHSYLSDWTFLIALKIRNQASWKFHVVCLCFFWYTSVIWNKLFHQI